MSLNRKFSLKYRLTEYLFPIVLWEKILFPDPCVELAKLKELFRVQHFSLYRSFHMCASCVFMQVCIYVCLGMLYVCVLCAFKLCADVYSFVYGEEEDRGGCWVFYAFATMSFTESGTRMVARKTL